MSIITEKTLGLNAWPCQPDPAATDPYYYQRYYGTPGGGNPYSSARPSETGQPQDFAPGAPQPGGFRPGAPRGQGGLGPAFAQLVGALGGHILNLQGQIVANSSPWTLLDLLPVGAILEWAGTKAALTAATSKWKIMDGTQGGSGQDRRSKFVRGSSGTGDLSSGATGGSNNHDHGGTTGNGGGHDHGGCTDTVGAHDHNGVAGSASVFVDSTNLNVAADCYASAASVWGFDSQSETFGAHCHAIDADGAHYHVITAEGDHNHSITSADNIPEYIETHWIEKIA